MIFTRFSINRTIYFRVLAMKTAQSCMTTHLLLPPGLNVPDVRRPDDGANAVCIVQGRLAGIHISQKNLDGLPRCCCAWFVLAHPP